MRATATDIRSDLVEIRNANLDFGDAGEDVEFRQIYLRVAAVWVNAELKGHATIVHRGLII